MITKTRLSWAIVATIAFVLLATAPLVAKSTITEYECSEVYLETLAEGTMTFLPNGRIHLRDIVNAYDETNDLLDPRATGTNYVVVNANWDENWLGPMWGTFTFETDEGGVWEGTWLGQMTEEGSAYHASGNGHGIYDGMKIWIDVAPESCHGRIMDHDWRRIGRPSYP
jgi:hypothetical protein